MGLLKGLFKGGRLGAMSDPFSIPDYKDEHLPAALPRNKLVREAQAQHLTAVHALQDQEQRVCRLLQALVQLGGGDPSTRSREAELMDCLEKIVDVQTQLNLTTRWLKSLGAVKERDGAYERLLENADELVDRVRVAIGCFVWRVKRYCRSPDLEKLGKRCAASGGFDEDENFEIRPTSSKSIKN